MVARLERSQAWGARFPEKAAQANLPEALN